ncbi:hypothetical protein MFFC18_05700 [Mariniblastus fucicola]|uniref:Heme oxygenase n=2 Tax=Mariniblastus fucicola TaxID=980251 RepID=A0A5B9P5E4_9BACT|nr:hypothetical protein MFFC18_05700 [Mariniblastus fucicola]
MRLHELIDLKIMLGSRRTYITALVAYLRAIRPCEAAVAFFSSCNPSIAMPDYKDRLQKSNWLGSDLISLGESVPDELHAVPRRDSISLATAAGYAYVMEGMTLGATGMLPRFERSLGLSASDGANFFAAYGSETPQMWKRFTAWIGQIDASQDDVVQAARFAFAQFEREFSSWNRTELSLLEDPSLHA